MGKKLFNDYKELVNAEVDFIKNHPVALLSAYAAVYAVCKLMKLRAHKKFVERWERECGVEEEDA